ncbi:MAG: hypothetical protein HWQ35_23755 [Nostoc sp. NMS1]|uniref:hypothetical protein n=1 Tax=unclassified Nostoc TaxID=2593658 RepID=UPI0025EFC8AF|nr:MULTISPECIES: hypothetical protein [unclassified Nostoc]MBN3909448.1 hypothetical protein [Nostoc sp. NMS1]MBN3994314.1 hypothetical protein [Nostoc sp. NMS2]
MPVNYEIFLYLNLKRAFRLIVKYLPTDVSHSAVLVQNGGNQGGRRQEAEGRGKTLPCSRSVSNSWEEV